jgi:hypothetical protein
VAARVAARAARAAEARAPGRQLRRARMAGAEVVVESVAAAGLGAARVVAARVGMAAAGLGAARAVAARAGMVAGTVRAAAAGPSR